MWPHRWKRFADGFAKATLGCAATTAAPARSTALSPQRRSVFSHAVALWQTHLPETRSSTFQSSSPSQGRSIIAEPLWSFSRSASIKANNLKAGALVEQDGRLLVVLKAVHTPGMARQGGNVQVEMRDVKTGSKASLKLSTNAWIQVAEAQRKTLQFLYHDTDGVHLMDEGTFEQVLVPLEAVGQDINWLSDGMAIQVLMHDGMPVSLELPATLVVTVVDTPEDRVSESGAKKVATVSTGARVMVPAFVQAGDAIVVKPSTAEFVRRHKE